MAKIEFFKSFLYNNDKLVTFDDDKINLFVKKVDDLQDKRVLEYDGTKQLLFWSLKHTKDEDNAIMLDNYYLKPKDKNIKPYLNISFLQEKVNLYNFGSNDPKKKMYEHI